MSEPKWLLRSVIDAIHDMQIAEHGGAQGVRDEALIESALARPKNKFSYGMTDICELAACLAVGLARNHPFVDGNKRTTFLAAFVFLRINGLSLIADEISATRVMIDLAAGEIEEAELSDWFKANTVVG